MKRLTLSEESYSSLMEVKDRMAAEDDSIQTLEQVVRNLILIYEEYFLSMSTKSAP
ncbi:MAG: hypothetical protein ACE5KH_06155 [Candidatus Geothermarchaeales archaeon]